jgi:hypothetical protein
VLKTVGGVIAAVLAIATTALLAVAWERLCAYDSEGC